MKNERPEHNAPGGFICKIYPICRRGERLCPPGGMHLQKRMYQCEIVPRL